MKDWEMPEYFVLKQMIDRCHNPANSEFHNYGGRGISVCDAWRGPAGFKAFLSDMGRRPPGPPRTVVIDRVNNDKDYSPENCRWTTQAKNNRNRRGNHLIEIDGVTKTLTEWSETSGISAETISSRIFRDRMPPKEAVFTADRRAAKTELVEIDGVSKPIAEWASISGNNHHTIRCRLRRGYDPKRAVFEVRTKTGSLRKAST